ncbi:flagellar basal body rod modification protein [Oceaniovalibus guishaninsula JLT2003]|uniref:Basal-body rod modification protein FlgD n=1 Tax=Oceaniovalibus guishaninsula JLT2003 TaxID=1231392 RepID=K2H835_9RHOB|nr:flagellar hook capping FlgD N-terminal domain-containing protein [Oceaniovalibus guishaninsula]EKE43793.1 flagellar basal body rod modification protein [Oceaniovalibus guishaninsula JLT2003]
MEVTTQAAPNPPGARTPAAKSISSDFDTFLTLLTAQISNQDPLSPMKSEEFAAQLATFSGVEQQVNTNKLLEQMLAQGNGGNFTQMASWIGREVKAQMPVMVDGNAVTIAPEIPVAGSRHELVVKDATGGVVHRIPIAGDGAPIRWAGEIGGGRVPPGAYSFSVESRDGDVVVATEPAPVYAQVTEVRFSPQGPFLRFAGGVELSSDAVSAIRTAPS